jgi:tetratricopeptide (TPR) repeat protein
VLLFDEPRSWSANRGGDDFFARRSFELAFLLTALPCRRVVAGTLPVPIQPQQRKELRPVTTDQEWLRRGDAWDALAPVAAGLADTNVPYPAMSPLQVRLAVAAAALTTKDDYTRCFDTDDGVHGLARFLARLVQERHQKLWEAWARLSQARRPFDITFLHALLPPGLSPMESAIVRHCFLFGDEEMRMHDVLKLQVAQWRSEQRGDWRARRLIQRSNEALFALHRERFDAHVAEHDPRAISESMEAFHHASATGKESLIQQSRPVFVDQLDALGWSLSYERHDFKRAVTAFEQAIAWDDSDDYAHHYLAYNLDRLGERIDDVEHHYRRAVDLNAAHPWWWSRLIIFLVEQGRLDEARSCWTNALLEVGAAEGDAPADTYERLHCWVAGALLGAGEARDAREILDAIPDWARSEIDLYDGLSQRTDAFLQLGEGPAVVPGWRLRPAWWTQGPELLQHRLGNGAQLVRWLAARVEGKDENGVRLRSAVLQPDQTEPPRIAWSDLAAEDFDRLCRDDIRARELPIGTFLEVGLYAKADADASVETLIRVLNDRPWAAGVSATRADRYLEPELTA